MKQVKYLDAIARNFYKNNSEQLHEWASASHVEHDPGHQLRARAYADKIIHGKILIPEAALV